MIKWAYGNGNMFRCAAPWVGVRIIGLIDVSGALHLLVVCFP